MLERHVGVEAGRRRGRSGSPTASASAATHRPAPEHGRPQLLDVARFPFQIPLGALFPQRIENLLPAGKNLGVTHITNGCYRLHPVEWNVGEAAGALAAFCLDRRTSPRAVRATPTLLGDFQQTLRGLDVLLAWPAEVRTQVR